MNDFVAMAKHVCEVCGITHTHNSNEILIHKNLRPIEEKNTVTGYGLCKEHDDLYKQGYIALVAIDEKRSYRNKGNIVKLDNAYRLGSIAHLRREIFNEMFNVTVDSKSPMVFVEEAVIDRLAERQKELTN